MDELKTEITDEIKVFCAHGYAAYDQHEWDEAIRSFFQAWNLLPEPKTEYREAGWILTALGDTYFRAKRYQPAQEALNSALHCPGINYNPFVMLRLGQVYYEQGNDNYASKTLAYAYKKGGRQLFEQESPKYLITALQSAPTR